MARPHDGEGLLQEVTPARPSGRAAHPRVGPPGRSTRTRAPAPMPLRLFPAAGRFAGAVAPLRAGTTTMSRQQRRDRLIFLVPSMTVLAVILFYPLLYSVGLSFYNYYLPVPRKTFVGLDNFRYIWADDAFWDALGVTARFTGAAVAIELVAGRRRRPAPRRPHPVPALRQHGGAPAHDHHARGRRPPHALDVREQLGDGELLPLAGGRARTRGGPAIPPGRCGRSILADVWQNTPFVILVVYAGLQSIPEEPLEAAMVDGATADADPHPRHLPVPAPARALRADHPVDGRVPHLRPGVRDDGRRAGHDDADHHLLQLRDGLPDAPDGARLRPGRRHAPHPVAWSSGSGSTSCTGGRRANGEAVGAGSGRAWSSCGPCSTWRSWPWSSSRCSRSTSRSRRRSS